jgi:predicted O-methyltransferase YrrM
MIVTDAVETYLASSRAGPDPVLAEMEEQGRQEGIPIVVPETGALLNVLAMACGARSVVEVGTAIGVSTLYLARALPDGGRVVTFEIDEARHRAARAYLERAGVLDRVDLRLQDAREGLAELGGRPQMADGGRESETYVRFLDHDADEAAAGGEGTVVAEPAGQFDMAFIDGVKSQYGDYFDALLPLLRPGGLLAVDNVLMGGTVAEGRSDGHWTDEQIATARAFNERLLADERFDATITPVGDGVLIGVRRG